MFKIAKSRIVKIVEQKLRDGDREGAMKLLREAEAADRTGAFTAKEIKGLHDDPSRVYGNGQYGRVRDRFYGGEMLPAKELRKVEELTPAQIKQFGDLDHRVSLHNAEAGLNRRMAKIIGNDPELRALGIKTPKYYGDNAHGMIGKNRADLNRELNELSRIKNPTRQQQGRMKEVYKILYRGMAGDPAKLDAYQVQPMSRLPDEIPAGLIGQADMQKAEARLEAGRQRLMQLGIHDADHAIMTTPTPAEFAKYRQHNARIGVPTAGGHRPIHLYDFGLARDYGLGGQAVDKLVNKSTMSAPNTTLRSVAVHGAPRGGNAAQMLRAAGAAAIPLGALGAMYLANRAAKNKANQNPKNRR